MIFPHFPNLDHLNIHTEEKMINCQGMLRFHIKKKSFGKNFYSVSVEVKYVFSQTK